MKEVIQRALTRMGYRELDKNTWGKPVGHQLLTYEFDRNELTNWFYGSNGKLLRWSTVGLLDDNNQSEDAIVRSIKWFEATTKLEILVEGDKNFDFLTLEQKLIWL